MSKATTSDSGVLDLIKAGNNLASAAGCKGTVRPLVNGAPIERALHRWSETKTRYFNATDPDLALIAQDLTPCPLCAETGHIEGTRHGGPGRECPLCHGDGPFDSDEALYTALLALEGQVPAGTTNTFLISRCPTHGIQGLHRTCETCHGPVEHVRVLPIEREEDEANV